MFNHLFRCKVANGAHISITKVNTGDTNDGVAMIHTNDLTWYNILESELGSRRFGQATDLENILRNFSTSHNLVELKYIRDDWK